MKNLGYDKGHTQISRQQLGWVGMGGRSPETKIQWSGRGLTGKWVGGFLVHMKIFVDPMDWLE